MNTRGFLIIGLIVAAAAVGCSPATPGAAASAASTPVTTTVHDATSASDGTSLASEQYLAAANKANAAIDAMDAKVGTLGDSPQASALAAALQPAIDALKQYETALTNIAWPADALADAHAVIQADAGLVGVLESTAEQNVFSAASFEAQVSGAAGQLKADVNLLRHDLGLPL